MQNDDVRKEYQGTNRINPVSGRVEPTFTTQERIAKYFQSMMLCAPYFAAIIFSNIIFLNLTGIINPERHHALF